MLGEHGTVQRRLRSLADEQFLVQADGHPVGDVIAHAPQGADDLMGPGGQERGGKSEHLVADEFPGVIPVPDSLLPRVARGQYDEVGGERPPGDVQAVDSSIGKRQPSLHGRL